MHHLPLHISTCSRGHPAGLAAGRWAGQQLARIPRSRFAGAVWKRDRLGNYKGNWGLGGCGWQVSAWPVNVTCSPASNAGGLLPIIQKEMRVAFIMCLHSNMSVLTGYIYTHYSSVEREVNPFPLSGWGTALTAAAYILRQVRTQTTSILLGGKNKPSSF